ncbi:MAG: tail fiber protein [Candidatus Nanopelagicales bacterium]|nr:tail fiber protein [Candidatus Nanopelagicales bacterium]
MSTIQAQAPLFMTVAPTQPNHAVTKQYVDNVFANIPGSAFVSGALTHENLPGFTGAFTVAAGASETVLSDSGITAGTYTRLNVNASGIAVEGRQLETPDVPGVPWSKVTTGKPNTAAGYGLYGLIGRGGGQAYNPVTSSSVPVNSDHLVTKGFVDNLVASSPVQTLPVGSIIRHMGEVRPDASFLRCNGSLLLKAEYPELHSKVGDRFGADTGFASGKPWTMQSNFNGTAGLDSYPVFTASGQALPTAVAYSYVAATNNKVYVMGGVIDGSITDNVWVANVLADGTLSAWSGAPSLPVQSAWGQVVVARGRIYLIGGLTNATVGYPSYPDYRTWSAPINADGSVGTWRAEANLPVGTHQIKAVVIKNFIYVFGGTSVDGFTYRISRARILPDGTLEAWRAHATMPFGIQYCHVAVWKDKLYLVGGADDAGWSSKVIYCDLDADGSLGVWKKSMVSMPVVNFPSDMLIVKNKMYVIGSMSGALPRIYGATIAADGTLWSFAQKGGNLPADITCTSIVTTHKKLHLLANFVYGANAVTMTYHTNFSGGKRDYTPYYDESVAGLVQDIPGNGQPWVNQVGINLTQSGDLGAWTQVLPTTLPPLQLHTSFVTNGYAYVVGGYTLVGGSSAPNQLIYRSAVSVTGELGSWTTVPSPGGRRYLLSAMAVNKTVFLIGGDVHDDPLNPTLYSAEILDDGTLGAWVALGQTRTRFLGNVVLTKSKLYLLDANFVEGNLSSVADVLPDGRFGNWRAADLNLPLISSRSMVRTSDKVYLIGGTAGVSVTDTITDTHVADILSDGTLSNFYAVSPFATGISEAKVVVTDTTAYLFGGRSSTGELSDEIHKATINPDGSLGAWTSGGTMMHKCASGSMFATSSALYHVGGKAQNGYGDESAIADVYKVPFTGGLSDYSNYYRELNYLTSDKYFGLPDYTRKESEMFNVNYFIKVK